MSDPKQHRFFKYSKNQFNCHALAKFSAICTMLLLKNDQQLPDKVIFHLAQKIGAKVEKTCIEFTKKP